MNDLFEMKKTINVFAEKNALFENMRKIFHV